MRNNMILTDDAIYLTIESPAGASTPILGVKKDDFSIWAIGGGNLPAATTGYADGGLCGVVGACRYAWWNVSGGGLANDGYICECQLDYSGAPAIVAVAGSIHASPYQIGSHVSDIKFDGVYTWYLDYLNRWLITCYEIETAAGILYIDRWEGTWANDYLRATTHYQYMTFDGQNMYWLGLEDGQDRIVMSQVDCRRTIYDAAVPGLTNMSQTPIFVSEPDFPSRPSARTTVGRIACAGGIIGILTDDDPNDEVFLLYDASAINANL
jgi:hypothetical protein